MVLLRGSWIAGVAVNAIAEDMTREGAKIVSEMDPGADADLQAAATHYAVWESLNDVIAWGRLYGGAIGVIMVDGQDPRTPLDVERVGRGQFKGIMVFDRWMIEPDLERMVRGPADNGLVPRSYWVVAPGSGVSFEGMRVHHTRCIRHEGVRLPYWQRVMENMWGISVLERLYDRLVAFDSATNGAAQLMYKSYLRTFKVENLRQIIAAGGQQINNLQTYLEWVRRYQGIEGITLMDTADEFEGHASAGASFAGIADGLVHFGQQISGGLEIPLVRLFGQSPAGLNSTGESDWRNYFDGIKKRQERELRLPVEKVYRVMARSEGIVLPRDFSLEFNPLLQMPEDKRAEITSSITSSVMAAEEAGLIRRSTALKELKEQSEYTGIFSNITSEEIEEADQVEEPLPGLPGTFPPGESEPGGGVEGVVSPGATPRPLGPVPLAAGGRQPPRGMGPPARNEPSAGGGPGGLGSPRSTPVPSDERARGLRVFGKPRLKVDAARDATPASRMLEFRGLPIYVETQRGEKRAPQYERPVAADYGFVRCSSSAEGLGEGLDVFVGPEPLADRVWVVNQVDPDSGNFDEHKCMLGFASRRDAMRAYCDSYDDGRVGAVGGVVEMTWPEFRRWLETGDERAAA